MSTKMRVLPFPMASDLRQAEPVVAVAAARPSIIAVQPEAEASGKDAIDREAVVSELQWLYELELARSLPIVNLSRTPISTLLSPGMHDQLVRVMPSVVPILALLFRLSMLSFGALLLLPATNVTPWVPLIVVTSMLTPLIFMAFISLDVLALLHRSYEFWFISTLSLLSWLGLALIFGDARAISCTSMWFASQSVIVIDANYRTYPAAVKSIVMSGPSMLALVVCCVYGLVIDAKSPILKLGDLTIPWRQITIFTASTLSVFMLKKAILKHRRHHAQVRGEDVDDDTITYRHTISCVVLQARLRLNAVVNPTSHDKKPENVSAAVPDASTAAQAAGTSDIASALQSQRLRLSNKQTPVVDARRTVIRGRLLEHVEASPRLRAALYGTGAVGLVGTATAWVLLFQPRGDNERLSTVVGIVAAVCSLLFTSATVALTQRDLLRLLAWNFDAVFSTLQGTALAACLLDLLSWRTASSLAVICWWLWFHWLLVLDALTPSVTRRFQIRKYFALVADLVVLSVAIACIVEISLGGSLVFSSRLLWSVDMASIGGFELHTDTLAMQRITTIVGWNMRLKSEPTEKDDTDSEMQWLYELQLTRPLPIVDLSRTPASTLLPSKAHDWLERAMPSICPLLVLLLRTSMLSFATLLFVSAATMKPWVPLIFATSVLSPLFFMPFLSLELLELLHRHYEYWFISALSLLNWASLGQIFGDVRMVTCVSLWLNAQSVAVIDANYRTFPAAVKSMVLSGPFMLMLVASNVYGLVADARSPSLELGKLTVHSRQIVVFTASTLSVFMLKKAFLKHRRHHAQVRDGEASGDATTARHTIPCVVLQARLRLNPVGTSNRTGTSRFSTSCQFKCQENASAVGPDASEVAQTPGLSATKPLHILQLRLSNDQAFTVDARRTLLPRKLLKNFEASCRLRSALYGTGAVGLAATATVWALLLQHHRQETNKQFALVLGIIAATCSLLFTSATVAFTQRDLLRLLAWNFDVAFSIAQGTALAVCLLDLLRWRVAPSLAVFSWWLWFHWHLVLDALTPTATSYFYLRKYFALPAVLLVLVIAAACALEISTGSSIVFASRLLWEVHVTNIGDFHLHTDTLAVQRVVTIVGWSARLVIELAVSDQNQLLYIRRHIEYASPYATFMDASSTDARKQGRWRCSRAKTSISSACISSPCRVQHVLFVLVVLNSHYIFWALHFEMRVEPLEGHSELRQVEPVFEPARKPSSVVVPRKSETGCAPDSDAIVDEGQSLYELRLAQPLLTVDLSRTPASTLLSSRAHDKLVAAMPTIMQVLDWISRVSSTGFVCLLVLPAATMTPWVVPILLTSVLPLMAIMAFLSSDVLAQLVHIYEFWFISALNTLNWFGLGLIFGDVRAVVCGGLWVGSQTVIAIDSNYRTYPIVAKTIVMVGPSMLALTVCCAYRLVADTKYPSLALGGLAVQPRQIVIFTSSTLAVFMVKKAYSKHHRMGVYLRRRQSRVDVPSTRHTIPCVVLQARLRLVPTSNQRRQSRRRLAASPLSSDIPANVGATASLNVSSAPQIQQLRLSNSKAFVVDSKCTLIRGRLLEKLKTSRWWQAALYGTGAVGLATTLAAWVMLLQQHRQHANEPRSMIIGAIAASCSLLFTLATVALAQRDLLRLLVWSFDVVFSTVQITTLAVCLLDLLRWRIASSLAVICWWLWFHWLLVLDALTPSVTHRLRLRKYFALPVILVVLSIASVCALDLVMDDPAVFSSRLLWRLDFASLGDFDLYTDTFAVQRVVTIVGWSTRLLIELVMGSPDRLLYIRRHVEYASPYPTFPDIFRPLGLEMRIQPLHSEPRQAEPVVGLSAKPGPIAVQSKREAGHTTDSDVIGGEEQSLYELRLAQSLPTLDLSRTPASALLSSRTHDRLETAMPVVMPVMVSIFGASLFGFVGLLVVTAATLKPWVSPIFVASLLPLPFVAGFLSSDVLVQLLHNYEFWFVSALNVLNWLGVGLIFGNVRAITCVGLCFNVQLFVVIDANYRAYPSATKAIMVAGPAMLALTVCSTYGLVADSKYPSLALGGLVLQSRQIVMFMSSTLAVFMIKKGYFKHRRMGVRPHRGDSPIDAPSARHTIPCVVLQARLRLVPTSNQRRQSRRRLTASPLSSDIPANVGATASLNVASAPQIQQLRLSNSKAFVVDSKCTLIRGRLLEKLKTSRWWQVALYGTGAVGLATTLAAWVMLLQQHRQHANEPRSMIIGAIAASCSLLFTLATVALAQRDLLRLLVWSFDVVFSTVQITTLAVCLLDLLRWRIASSLAVICWWLWFHWLLVLDALTPSVTHRLRLRKYFALPVILVVLSIASVCALGLLMNDDALFSTRLLWSMRVTNIGDFNLYTDSLAVQRVVTIVGWSTRLVIELLWAMGLRGTTRRASPVWDGGVAVGPSTIAVRPKHEETDARDNDGDDGETQWLYELQLARPLPAVDLSRTLASVLLSSNVHDRLVCTMHAANPFLLMLFRMCLLSFASLLFTPATAVSPWIPVVVVASFLTLVGSIIFFSLDMLALLLHYYEFWFISALNTLNWVGMALVLGDLRAASCLSLWFSSQTIVAIDANYRTYPAAVKTVVLNGPSMLVLVVCCAYQLVADSKNPSLKFGGLVLHSHQTVIFTASTLSVFMVKKAYLKHHRMDVHPTNEDDSARTSNCRHRIPCVVLQARLRLNPFGSQIPHSTNNEDPSASSPLTPSLPQVSRPSRPTLDATRAPQMQQLQLSNDEAVVVDARRTVVASRLLERLSTSCWWIAVLYWTGIVGLATTGAVWVLLLQQNPQEANEQLTLGMGIVAAACTLIFTSATVALSQRDLLRLLVWNFDVVFSAVQGTALSVCLLDLLRWRPTSSLAVISWWLWFHWLLVLDALTPSAARQLRLRKYFGLPVILVVLAVASVCAVALVMEGDVIFSSRLLWDVHVARIGDFRLHTDTLAAQRVLTIVGWSARLVIELAIGNPDQLLSEMRIQPLPVDSEPRHAEPVLGRPVKPSSIAIQSKHETAHTSDSDGIVGEEQWLYELRPAQPLPTVDLSRTTASTLLSSTAHTKLEAIMPAMTPGLIFTFRVSMLCFVGLLSVSAAIMRPWVPLMLVTSLVPLLFGVVFLSLDVLALLLRNYEFWFISVLNTLNWLGLGLIFGDVRAGMCLSVGFTAQVAVAIDANYRTYPTTIKAIVLGGPLMLGITVCCAYQLVTDASYPTLELGRLRFHSRLVVIFTASTHSVFMVKKAYARHRRMGTNPSQQESRVAPNIRHTIPCVVLQARLRLDPVGTQSRLSIHKENTSPLMTNIPEEIGGARPPNVARPPQIQHFRLSNDETFVVDARRTVVHSRLLERLSTSCWWIAALYSTGAVGLATTGIAWVLLLQPHQQEANEHLSMIVGIVAVTCSLIFTSATVALSQRDLLRLLVWNFDVVFSAVQGTALALCLLDLLRWRPTSSLAVISWWLWFHWLLVLDALTPSVTHRLRLRKLFALPAILLVLVIASVCALGLQIEGGALFSSRLLWSVRVARIGNFDLHTSTLAVQRIATIVGWSARLVIELTVGNPDQLLYIRRYIEYASPYATFSEPQPQQERSGRRRWPRCWPTRSALVPEEHAQPDITTMQNEKKSHPPPPALFSTHQTGPR
ncbi:hypothetical protein BBJ28_00002893 [Nothophytophthora sp. Chile5]|nr:hypothetical protein BBJ28_00002893 [Nothophytophthora sp. Chile5]